MAQDFNAHPKTVRHEVGHAIAAIKTGGRVKEMNLGDRDVNDEYGYTHASYPQSEAAFYHYAGSWTQAKFDRPDKPVQRCDIIPYYWLQNLDDAVMFRDATGITRPHPAWHEKVTKVLAKAWDDGEIQGLAEQFIALAPEIDLHNGQMLIRRGENALWRGTDYYDVPDNGGGLVGPPTPPN